MSDQIVATREHGHWVVPVGSIINDENVGCDSCGHWVSILTVRTADGIVRITNDLRDYADVDSDERDDWHTICHECPMERDE